jgi:GntR family transcriptional regulator
MLDKESPMPLYLQARELLEERIQSGHYQVNQKIPSENELSIEFGISRMTLRQVVKWLERDGFLYTIQGKGTYVAKPKITAETENGTGIIEQLGMIEVNLGCTNQVLEIESYSCPPSLQKIMGLETTDKVYRLEMLGQVNEEPLWVGISYIPQKFCPQMEVEKLKAAWTVDLLRETFGLVPSIIEQTIEAVSATKEDAQALNVKKGHPLLSCTIKRFTKDMQVYEYCSKMYLGEKVKLRIRQGVKEEWRKT